MKAEGTAVGCSVGVTTTLLAKHNSCASERAAMATVQPLKQGESEHTNKQTGQKEREQVSGLTTSSVFHALNIEGSKT